MQHEDYAKLLSLNYNLFDITDYQELIDYIVNDSRKILPYQLAIIYSSRNKRRSHPEIIAISGAISHETDVNFNNWLKDVIEYFHSEKKILNFSADVKNEKNILHLFHPDEINEKIKESWAQNLGQEVQIAKLYANKEQQINLILFNNVRLDETQLINLNFIIKSYRQALSINLRGKSAKKTKKSRAVQYLKLLVIVAVIPMFIPITPSIMAPAEIISQNTWSINSPINGTIKNINVEPNSYVKNKTILFKYDTLDLKNNLRLKQQELKKLETEKKQAMALGFQDLEERAKIFRLNQDIAAKKQEIYYASEMFDLSTVKSPADGILLFKDKNDLIGKPHVIGETVMRLADVNSKVIEIWLNIDDSIQLKENMPVYYYSNSAPFSAVKAKLIYYSYEAYITPQNEVAFRLLAKFEQESPEDLSLNNLSIGDHGQVKIYGSKKILLGLFIFQKPIATLRKWLYRVV